MRVLIADDHALFRESLRKLMEDRNIHVVGEATTGVEAVNLATRLRPDVVLMDLKMPEMDGLAATKIICAQTEGVKVVVLTGSSEDADLFEAIKCGAEGYLRKDLEAKEFFALLDGVNRGEPALSPSLARKLLKEFADPHPKAREVEDPDALTPREEDVLRFMVEGTTSNRALARRLGVSENTVKFHVRNILDKLHLHNRAQVVGYAYRHGIVDSAESAS